MRKDRNKDGGGVMIALKGDLVASHRPDLDADAEILWVQLEIVGSKPLLIGAFYRPQVTELHEMDYLMQLNQSLKKIDHSKRQQIWLAGDFNLPGINWDTLSTTPGGYKPGLSKEFLNMTADIGLEQLVDKPTRKGNILDLFLTTHSTLVEKSTVLPGLSDHDGIPCVTLSTKARKVKQQRRKIFMFKKTNTTSMKEDLTKLSEDIVKKYHEDAVNTTESLWNDFKSGLTTSIDKHIPSKMITSRSSSPWLTQNIRRAHKRKQRAYNHYRKTKDPADLDKFKDLRSEISNMTRKTRRRYVRRTCEDTSKSFWGFIKNLRQDSFGISSLKDKGDLISDNLGKAEVLNNQFRKVFTKEDTTSIPDIDGDPFPEMPNIQIAVPGIEKLLSKLKPKKASGPDNLPSRVLKDFAAEIAPALTCIMQRSLNTGTLPEDWRCANITPVFKKGDRTMASNYRPVSLTAICSKLLEHVIHANIMDHLDRYQILCDEQHGFRSKHSCESQLILTVHDLAKTLDQQKQSDIVIMDFSKAFDKVAHHRLLRKIHHYGIRGQTYEWISSFLQERKQRVVVGGDHSQWVHVESGVPQGTVLGPMLFILFINDLPNNIKSPVRLFADDCVLYNTIESQKDADQLQHDLDSLRNWEQQWQMEFNAAKCFVMRISHANTKFKFDYSLGNSILQETEDHTYLGVKLTSDLRWNKQVNKVRASANRSLGFLRRNISSCSRRTKTKAFNTFVRPHLEYCSTIWDPYTVELINKLDNIQRRGARFVFNDYDYTSHPSDMITSLGWDSLALRRKERRILVLHKALHGHLSIPATKILRPTARTTRSSNAYTFVHFQPKKDCYKYSFFPRTVVDWSNLPINIISTEEPVPFKTKLHKHLRE